MYSRLIAKRCEGEYGLSLFEKIPPPLGGVS